MWLVPPSDLFHLCCFVSSCSGIQGMKRSLLIHFLKTLQRAPHETPLCGSQNSFFAVCPHNTDIILWSAHSQASVDWIHSQSRNSAGGVWERKPGLNMESSLDFYLKYLSIRIGFRVRLMKRLICGQEWQGMMGEKGIWGSRAGIFANQWATYISNITYQ